MVEAVRRVTEITREEAEQIVGENSQRFGFEFWFMVNKSAAVFRRTYDGTEQYGIVLGQADGVQSAPNFRWAFAIFRENYVIYEVTGMNIG